MKKIITILIFAASFSLIANSTAAPVTLDEAEKIAHCWFRNIAPSHADGYAAELVYTARFEGMVTFYVFSFRTAGFVIVSADDEVTPILGYSPDDRFPVEIDCPAVQSWLDNYSRMVANAVKSVSSNTERLKQWDAIRSGNVQPPSRDVSPLLITTWGQGCYYNAQCPVDAEGPCNHALTGCGATAMAQIMKYYNFPPIGVGTHSYFHPVYGEQSVNFGETEYGWASMPYHLNTYNLSVATLMYHAGVSVNAVYHADVTNALFDDIRDAFIDHFNFYPGITNHYRSDYPDQEEWENLIRAELDVNRPVFYHGVGPESGHYFICDGYNSSDDMFHFNWGWNGNYNGWFLINALNPGGNDFNTYNAIMTNLKPYNPDLCVRIVNPVCNSIISAGQPADIETLTIIGYPDKMKLTIDGLVVKEGFTQGLNYTWITSLDDAGSHEVKVWSFTGDDSVYCRINMNVCSVWIPKASGFETPMRAVCCISAVDTNTAWAIVREGIDEWAFPIQEFTRTTDGGETWVPGTIPGCDGLSPGMIFAISSEKAFVSMYRLSGNTPQGIYVTSDAGLTWTHLATASFSNPYSFPDCIHFFDENNGWCLGDPVPQGGGMEFEIYTTTDGGETWVLVPPQYKPNPSPSEYGLLEYAAVNDTIWFGTTKGRVYKSTDRGYTYTVSTIPGMEDKWITPVFRNGSHGIVHGFFDWGGGGKLCETFDGGETWIEIAAEGPLYKTDLAYIPGTLNTWVSTGHWSEELGEGASVSFDGGHTWAEFPGTFGAKFRNMAWVNNHCGWAGSYNENDSIGGIFKFNGELTMTPAPLNLQADVQAYDVNLTWHAPLYYETLVTLVGYNIFRDGIKLNANPIPETYYNDTGLAAGAYTYCVTAVYEEGESATACIQVDVTVGTEEQTGAGSQQLVVNCYPNPTAGISHFAFHISQCQWVTLKIYDLYGREVAVLSDEKLPAGEHIISWNAEALPAGIYFYRLSTVQLSNCPTATGKILKH